MVGEGVSLEDFQLGLRLDEGAGNRLAFNEWRRGVYINVEGDTSQEYLFNYHTHSDKLFIMNETQSEVFNLNENLVQTLLLQSTDSGAIEAFQLISWQSFRDFPEHSRFCTYLVKDSDFELIKYYDKELKALGRKADSYDKFKKGRYTSQSKYFWRSGEGQSFEELTLTKQGIQAILNSSKQKRLKDLLKKRKVRWGNESEVVRLLKEIF